MLLDMTRHAETVTSCAWLPDGKTFVTGSTDQKLTHWVRTFCMRCFSLSTLNSASVASLVSRRAQDMKGNSLYTWLGEIVLDLAVSPDGTRVVTVSPRWAPVCFLNGAVDLVCCACAATRSGCTILGPRNAKCELAWCDDSAR